MYKNSAYSITIFLLFLFSVSLVSSKQLSLAKLLTPLHLSRSPQTQFLSLNSKNLRSNYAIDDVLTMMKELLNTTQTEINTLNEDWAVSKAQKDANINDFLNSLNSQASICNEISQRLNEANETSTDLNDTLSDYAQKIEENQQKIDNLLQQRCDANSQYIDSLKNNKQLLALIEILREAVQQFNQSFVQKKQFDLVHSKLIVFLNRYTLRKKARMGFLQNKQDVPAVEERTEEEIGTGHIDNTEDEISLEDFDSESISDSLQSIKTRLLNILAQIESDVTTDMSTYEANEIAANEKAATVKLNLESEITYLSNKILTLQEDLDSELVSLDNIIAEFDECETVYSSFLDSYNSAVQDLADSTENYNGRLADLNEELELFTQIVYIYQTQVASSSEQYKARTEDYVDDQTFNSGQNFNNRTIYDVAGDS